MTTVPKGPAPPLPSEGSSGDPGSPPSGCGQEHKAGKNVLPPSRADVASALCPDCGLCCNGVLFDRVILQPGDQIKPLMARGLKVKKRQFFLQPCQALCGTRCRMYQDRPVRCREFECRQYRQVAAGEFSIEEASQKIAAAKALVAQVEEKLAGTAGGNCRKPLAQRVATALLVMPQGPESDALQQALEALQELLRDHFRVLPPSA